MSAAAAAALASQQMASDHASDGGMRRRGVTRPMPLMHGGRGGSGDAGGDSGEGEDASHGGEMSREQRLEMLRTHHQQTQWIYWTLILLGLWTATAPVTFGYTNQSIWVDPAGGRGVWFSEQTHTALRASLMVWSDVISGLLLVFFGWRSLRPNRPISLWICCWIGIWLTLAPVLFWAPTAGAYVNATVVGALVIALTVLIPGMPSMIMFMQMGPSTPPGWTYNPSSWPQRWSMIALAFVGWLVSRYLGAFQLGYIDHAWDPFFGDSTRKVLTSKMSEMWPISDGGLGATSYTFEFLMGWMGAPSRWRTMPWMVTIFGILVIPLGLTHIVLVISQPLVVGEWCTLCLLAAAVMLPMIPLEADEVVAMGQHLVEARRRGDRGGSLWKVFWLGGSAEGCTEDERSPGLMQFPHRPLAVLRASVWGMSVPWTLAASAALGVWLMFTPGVLGVARPASHAFHLCGSLVVVVSVIAMGEVARAGRLLNVLLGLGVAAAPWFLDGADLPSRASGLIVGFALAALALPRGVKQERYGLWDRFVV